MLIHPEIAPHIYNDNNNNNETYLYSAIWSYLAINANILTQSIPTSCSTGFKFRLNFLVDHGKGLAYPMGCVCVCVCVRC